MGRVFGKALRVVSTREAVVLAEFSDWVKLRGTRCLKRCGTFPPVRTKSHSLGGRESGVVDSGAYGVAFNTLAMMAVGVAVVEVEEPPSVVPL